MRRVTSLAMTLVLLAAATAGALPFETVSPGGRSAAIGGMHGLLSQDAEAVLGNPALLGQIEGLAFQTMTRDWYGSGLRSYSVALARPLGGGGVGLAWHRFGHTDLWTEDLLALAGAYVYQLPTGSLRLGIGGSLKLMQVAAPGYHGSDYEGDANTWAGDLSLFAEPFPFLRVSWVGENFAAGEMTLLHEGENHRSAPSRHRTGASMRWRDDLIFGLEYLKRQDRDGKVLLGGELGFFRAFYVRAGAGAGFATAGFGLDGGWWQTDGAFESRGTLGTSLIFSLRITPGKERRTF